MSARTFWNDIPKNSYFQLIMRSKIFFFMNNQLDFQMEKSRLYSDFIINPIQKYCQQIQQQQKDLEYFTTIKQFINKSEENNDSDHSNQSNSSEASNTVPQVGNRQQQLFIRMFDIIAQLKRTVKQQQKLCTHKIKKIDKLMQRRQKEIQFLSHQP